MDSRILAMRWFCPNEASQNCVSMLKSWGVPEKIRAPKINVAGTNFIHCVGMSFPANFFCEERCVRPRIADRITSEFKPEVYAAVMILNPVIRLRSLTIMVGPNNQCHPLKLNDRKRNGPNT